MCLMNCFEDSKTFKTGNNGKLQNINMFINLNALIFVVSGE